MINPVVRSARISAFRATVPTITRQFHSSLIARETMGEKVREMGHKVNLKVGQGLASAIDTGEKVTQATKEKMEGAQEDAKESKDHVEKKAGDVMEDARKSKENLKKELDT
ncbi:hypothetical protein P691DRAFT_754114 [Macrolepiota fuliginosa MF-IS2]|uniref:Uncharacterized protein n=1 Tax=Macrolepiota fuliginosa MF-IS2 TaxID=1400762 RepID=A0A9P6CBC4_9AGAR|nr:hypothetical protein P691DRAFT_754114 [Macrolepiota fuliginosa MF-IS2]